MTPLAIEIDGIVHARYGLYANVAETACGIQARRHSELRFDELTYYEVVDKPVGCVVCLGRLG